MSQMKKYQVTMTILCRPQMIEALMNEFSATADYENAEVLNTSVTEKKVTYR